MTNTARITINSVKPVLDNPESDNPTSYRVRATVVVEDRTHETVWSGIERDGRLTNVGWETSDQWVDEKLAEVVGHERAVEIGEEVLASASVDHAS